MIEKEITYKLTLTDIQALKLLHFLMEKCDTELWDNELETVYCELRDSVDTETFNRYIMSHK